VKDQSLQIYNLPAMILFIINVLITCRIVTGDEQKLLVLPNFELLPEKQAKRIVEALKEIVAFIRVVVSLEGTI